MVRNSNKGKKVYSGCGIAFDSARSWSSGYDFSRNFIIFGIDNCNNIF